MGAGEAAAHMAIVFSGSFAELEGTPSCPSGCSGRALSAASDAAAQSDSIGAEWTSPFGNPRNFGRKAANRAPSILKRPVPSRGVIPRRPFR